MDDVSQTKESRSGKIVDLESEDDDDDTAPPSKKKGSKGNLGKKEKNKGAYKPSKVAKEKRR